MVNQLFLWAISVKLPEEINSVTVLTKALILSTAQQWGISDPAIISILVVSAVRVFSGHGHESPLLVR
jgi:hypothetical protein